MSKQKNKYEKKVSWTLFDGISERYNILNDVLSLGILSYWRKILVDLIPTKNDISILDCATGTGEVMFSIMKKKHSKVDSITGLDLSKNMMAIGEKKKQKFDFANKMTFQHASATNIPYNDASFDCVTMAFGIRNVDDYRQCLSEIHRVLKKDGKCLVMEFSLPKNKLFKSIYLFYFRYILPYVAGAISGDIAAYKYLNETVESFPYGKTFAQIMNDQGFQTTFKPLTFGIVTIYTGQK